MNQIRSIATYRFAETPMEISNDGMIGIKRKDSFTTELELFNLEVSASKLHLPADFNKEDN
jgi:hypothetical protein